MATLINCSDAHRDIINRCLESMQEILNSWDLPCLTDVREQLQFYLDGGLEITCEDCDSDTLQGYTPGGEDDVIVICRNTLNNSSEQRTCIVMFHEMIHAAGGTELDSEALESHFFTGAGATPPTAEDFTLFRARGGEFVEWVEATGELFGICMDESYATSRGSQLSPVFIG